MKRFRECLIAAVASFALALPAWAAAGSLVGSSDASALVRDLTAEGSTDWIYWGGASPERKSGGGSLISNVTVINPTGRSANRCFGPQALTWSDGTTIAINAGGLFSGVCTGDSGNGFSFTAPADGTPRTLLVHVGGANTLVKLTAHLSDGSAPDYVDVVPVSATAWDRNYMLTYNAAGGGQTLNVSWIVQSGSGAGAVSWLAAAALRPAGAPFYYLGKVPLTGNPVSLSVSGNVLYGCELSRSR